MPLNKKALEELINESGLSVCNLARNVGITRQRFYSWLKGIGEPSTSSLDKMYQYAGRIGLGRLKFYITPAENAEEIADFRASVHGELSGYSARELAYHFANGEEDTRIIYWDFLRTKSNEFQNEFQRHLEDPLLGEREEDQEFSESLN